jgi:hypothetical protein
VTVKPVALVVFQAKFAIWPLALIVGVTENPLMVGFDAPPLLPPLPPLLPPLPPELDPPHPR